jgi:hypothetical protein
VMRGSTLVSFDLKEFLPGVGSPGRWIHMEREWGAFVRRWGKKNEPEVKDERLKRPKWEGGREEGRRLGLGFMVVAPLPPLPHAHVAF